jgi:type IV pilus assembly protein PilW
MSQSLDSRSRIQRERGFSLIELMVAITLGLMIIAVIGTLFANTSRARSDLERTSQQIDSARYAVETISEDLQLAGFYGELNTAALAVPAALPDVCSSAPSTWLDAIPLHVQGYDQGIGVPACVPGSIVPDTDVLVVRRVRTCQASTPGCDSVVPTEPYLQVALCGSSPSSQRIGIAADTAFSLTQKDCTTPASLRRYVVHVYFISSNNGLGVNTPTLKRAEFNGAAFVEVALADGIEQLQVEYGIDTDGDGSPDHYTADATTFTFPGCSGCAPASNWANVVAAKVHVLARSGETVAGHVDRKVYELGTAADGTPVRLGPFNDGYSRHVYSTAVRLMNPSARRDRP